MANFIRNGKQINAIEIISICFTVFLIFLVLVIVLIKSIFDYFMQPKTLIVTKVVLNNV